MTGCAWQQSGNIAKALRVNLRNHYRLRGFIADEPELMNKVMMGVRVFPNDDTLLDVLNDRDVLCYFYRTIRQPDYPRENRS